jgi:hypothetical protein
MRLRGLVAGLLLVGLVAHADPRPGVILPTISTSGSADATAAAAQAGIAHLIRPTTNAKVLFHWTSPESAGEMAKEGIRIHSAGESTNGARSG